MGGGMDEWYWPSFTNEPRTMVLIGRSGNGKSATGNSILGKPEFESRISSSGVTKDVECHSSTLVTEEVVNVIDTPDLSRLFSCKEISQCVKMPKDGIHAVLLVISLRGRFTEEDAIVIQRLSPKITDYMIVVFTGGDCLEKDESLEDYLGSDCPKALQKILRVCKNRYVIFDNKTNDEIKKTLQLVNVLSVVDEVMEENGGQPYTDNLLANIEEEEEAQTKSEVVDDEQTKPEDAKTKPEAIDDEQLKRVVEMIECKIKETNKVMQQELVDEIVARLDAKEMVEDDAEEIAEDDNQENSDYDDQTLRENVFCCLVLALFFILCLYFGRWVFP